jgi:LPS export ABC transporter protein LptC
MKLSKQLSFFNGGLEYRNRVFSILQPFRIVQFSHTKQAMAWFYCAIVATSFLFIVGCDSDLTTVPREVTESDLYVERATNVEILYSDSAVVRLSIQAPVLLNHIQPGKEKKEFPNGIKVDFFNAFGLITSSMTAKSATQNERDNKIFIRKEVKVKSGNNETLETDELIWDERTKKLYTDKWVKVSTANEVIYGYGFAADQEFTYWKISKVRGRFTVNGNFKDDFR